MLIVCSPNNAVAQDVPIGETGKAEIDTSKNKPTKTIPVNRMMEEPVIYNARDSIRLNVIEQKVYLYGGAVVKFGEIELKAGYIEYDFKMKNVCAYPRKDSVGNDIEFPEFTDGKETFVAKLMCYNFESKKAFVEGSRAKQGEGFVLFDKVKIYPNKEVHGRHGKYTTCDLEHPHYYFNISKAVVKPNDKIVAGPLMLYIADVPTPLALPFGFFPNQKNKGAGLIIPTYDNSVAWGSGLLNGGYYFPIKDVADVQLTGSIYSKGTWGVRAITRYKNLYKYNGNFQLSFQQNIYGDKDLKELTNYSKSSIFSIQWNHNQDVKARPNSTFSANVNYNSNARSDITQTGTGFLNNSYQSAISYRKIFPNTPFSVNFNASQSGTFTPADTSQNRQSYNNLTFNLPDINFAMNRIYPLRGLQNETNRTKKWIKEAGKIYLTWNSQFKNTVSFIDTALYDSTLGRNDYAQLIPIMRNGINHNLSAGTSLKIFKKSVTINPSIQVTERWYFQTLNKSYDPIADQVNADTLRGPSNWARAMDGSFNVTATSKIYGYFQFAGFAKGKRKALVRHVLTPSLGFNYNPNFNSLSEAVYRGDSLALQPYSRLSLGIYGYPPNSESKLVSLNLTNSLEMKIKTKTDTGWTYKKVKLIDNLTVGSSYDAALDSFKLRNITVNGRTTLFKTISLNGGMNFNPYARNEDKRIVNKYLFKETGKLARFTGGNLAASFGISDETFSKKKKEDQEESEEPDPSKFHKISWNGSFNYNLIVNRTITSSKNDSTIFVQTAGVSGMVNFTQNWRIGFNLNYDVTNKELSYTSLDIYRDLHCWEMKLGWVPFGPRQSYNFQINVKSSILQDLRYKKQSQPNEFR